MYIIRNMSYSTSKNPETLEPERLPYPFKPIQRKNSHQMVAVTDTTNGGEGSRTPVRR